MSETETETAEEPAEDPDPEEPEEESDTFLPEIDADEKADLSAVAADIQAATDEDMADEGDEGDTSDDGEKTDSDESEADSSEPIDGGFGETYENLVVVGLTSAVEARGGDPDPEKYRNRAQQARLAHNFDRMMENRGFDEMSPEQAVVASTLLMVLPTLAEDTDLLTEVLGA